MAFDEKKNEKVWNDFISGSSVDKVFIDNQMDIAAQIDTFLKQSGWTQKQLAEKAGLRPSQLSKIMAGEGNPTLRTISNLEKALGRDIIVCPEFYEEKLLGKGWSEPGKLIELTAGVYRSETVADEPLKLPEPNWNELTFSKADKYNSADDYHLKPAGT